MNLLLISYTRPSYAIDCPGIVPAIDYKKDFKSDSAKVLKGVVRAEKLEAPSAYIDEVLERVKAKYLLQKYNMPDDTTWVDGEDFLTKLAKKMGKLRKGGEANIETVARIVLYDWQRGRIPYFVAPPGGEKKEEKAAGATTEGAPADHSEQKKSTETASTTGSAASPSASTTAPSADSTVSSTTNPSTTNEDPASDQELPSPPPKNRLDLDALPEQDLDTVVCAHAYDLADQKIAEVSPEQQRLKDAKLKKMRRQKAMEKEMAMRSDESDCDELDDLQRAKDEDAAPRGKRGAKKGQGVKKRGRGSGKFEGGVGGGSGEGVDAGEEERGGRKGKKAKVENRGSGLVEKNKAKVENRGSGLVEKNDDKSAPVDWARAMDEFNAI